MFGKQNAGRLHYVSSYGPTVTQLAVLTTTTTTGSKSRHKHTAISRVFTYIASQRSTESQAELESADRAPATIECVTGK